MIPYEELAEENARLLGIIKALKAENAVLRSMLPPGAELPTRSNEPETKPEHLDREAIIAQRLSLFRSLFRGREDVYAKRWVSKDGQRAGYKPICDFTNERGWCTRFPYGTANCSKCQTRQNRALTDEAIARNLNKNAADEDVIGIYPMLDDNSVYFLCADFDDKTCKHGYAKDVLPYIVSKSCQPHKKACSLSQSEILRTAECPPSAVQYALNHLQSGYDGQIHICSKRMRRVIDRIVPE